MECSVDLYLLFNIFNRLYAIEWPIQRDFFLFKQNSILHCSMRKLFYPLKSLQTIGIWYFCLLAKLTLVYEQFFPCNIRITYLTLVKIPTSFFLWNSSATHFNCKNTSDKENKNKKEQIFNMELSVSISFSS